MSLAFLYNVASCIAYALAIAAYGSLYYVERKPGTSSQRSSSLRTR